MSQIPAENNTPKRKNIFKRLYQGELSLPLTFWGFNILGSVVIMFIIGIIVIVGIVLALILMAENVSVPYEDFVASLAAAGECAAFVLCYLMMGPYTFVLAVAQWRAAEKYQGRKIWALLAKICTVFDVVYAVYYAPEGILVIVDLYRQAYMPFAH